jgi:ribosomal protein S18 acetylase RimI-like enzyme
MSGKAHPRMSSKLVMLKNYRPAVIADGEALSRLMKGRGFIHRHLAWTSPLDWLGLEPFLIREEASGITAVLACPPDEDGITWLQLFAVAPGNSLYEAWNDLWPPARDWLQTRSSANSVSCLVIHDQLKPHLQRSGFQEVSRVVVMLWVASRTVWPPDQRGYGIREMAESDLGRIHEIDQQAFQMIWRNSPGQLAAAYRVASSATVIDVDGRVAGYQISTVNPQGGHLARLAVDPAYQQQGIGTALLDDLLNRFLDQGILNVSVNTQTDNHSSLELYRKFGFCLVNESYPVYQYKLRD